MTSISTEYKHWLTEIKQQIRRSQIKAAVKVNAELLRLYWDLGREISERQMDSAWGSGFFDTLSRDLKAEFPDMRGFSPTNLKYCKRFYLFYNQSNPIRHQAGDELDSPIFSVPWRHHIEIMSKCRSVDEALFYVNKTLVNGWSRATLMNFLDAQLYSSQGKAVTNFGKYLPEPMSDLAQQTLKDPYNFDFLTMREPVLYNLGGFGFGHRCFLVFVFAYFLWCRRPDFLLALGECGHKLLRCVFVEFQVFGDFLCLYFGELFA